MSASWTKTWVAAGVLRASATPEALERMKANHGQPLHVWRRDFAAQRLRQEDRAPDGEFQHRF